MSLVAESAHRLRISVDTAKLRDLSSEISWAKVSNTSPEDYPRIAAASNRQIASMDSETIARIFAGYEAAKRDRGRIDFEDILLCAAGLLSEHAEIRGEVQRAYRHLVVDEYQDVSPLQQALLDLWAGERSDLCVVGDPAQTIHSFAGARASYLTGFARRHPDASVIRLVRDYRSTPQVVRSANAVMKTGPGGGLTAVTLHAQRPTGPDPTVVEAPDEGGEAAAVADWIVGLATDGVPYREMAVLFRINAQSPVVEQALAERRIPYLVRGGERFYERPEVRQALHALRTQVRAGESDGGGARVTSTGDAGRAGVAGLDGEAARRGRCDAGALGIAGRAGQRRRGSRGLGREKGLGRPVRGRGRARSTRRGPARPRGPGRHGVDTAFGQGLEWDAVALFGCHEGSLPFVLATSSDQIAEERRLLYVGNHPCPRTPADLLGAHAERRVLGSEGLALPRPSPARIRAPSPVGAQAGTEPRIAAVAAVPNLRTSAR